MIRLQPWRHRHAPRAPSAPPCLIVLLMVATACSRSELVELDAAQPVVLDAAPADGSTDVSVTTPVTVTFDEPMDPTSLDIASFFVTSVTGTVTASENIATFTPMAAFAVNRLYSAILTTGARDASGNNLAADVTWTFSTGPAACAASSTVEIDGDSDEWWAVTRHAIPSTKTVVGSVDDDADASAELRVEWNDAFLYVLVEVTDDIVGGSSEHAYENDGVELYLDGGYERGTTYDANDYQLTVDWQNQRSGSRQDAATFEAIALTTDTGYVVEYAIAWSSLAASAEPGTTIGLDVAVNDNDNGATQRDAQIMWNGNGDDWFDPSQMAAFTLRAEQCGAGL